MKEFEIGDIVEVVEGKYKGLVFEVYGITGGEKFVMNNPNLIFNSEVLRRVDYGKEE